GQSHKAPQGPKSGGGPAGLRAGRSRSPTPSRPPRARPRPTRRRSRTSQRRPKRPSPLATTRRRPSRRPPNRPPTRTTDHVFDSLLNAFRAPDIRRRVLYVLALLIVFRLLASVPIPGVDTAQLKVFGEGSALAGLLDLFSGGGLSHFSVVALGMNPYINASIIMQLMTGVVPSLQALSREGEYG